MARVLKFDDIYVPVDKISSCTISKDFAFGIGTKDKYTLSVKVDGGITYNVITGVEDKSLLETFILDKIWGNADGVLTYDETPLTAEENKVRKEKIKKDKEDEKKPDEFKEEKKEEVIEDEQIKLVPVDKKEPLTKEEIKEVFNKAKKNKKKGD